MIDRSQPADNQTIAEWWQSLEVWSKDEQGIHIPNRGLCETPSAEIINQRRVYETATPAEIKASRATK